MTQTHLNTLLWTLNLCLQALLLASLLLRATARTLPAFTSLAAFYLLRSVLLFTLFGHIPVTAYLSTANALSLLDLALEVAVAWELFRATRAAVTLPHLLRPLALFSLLAALAAAFAWELSHLLPRNVRTPVDRGVLFVSALMLAVALTSAWNRFSPASRRVTQGLGILALTAILSQAERTLAASHRNASAFQRWSYAEPIGYLLVLLFWLLTLRAEPILLPASRSHKAVVAA